MAATTLSAVRAEIKDNPGKVYVYVLSRPDGTPFYVGVGTGRRITKHEARAAKGEALAPALMIIQDILTAGQSVGYEIAGWFDDWTAAAAEERRLIALHGRADLGLGPLANRTNGGQGTAGIDWHRSAARKEGARKAAEKNRGRKHSEETKAKLSAANKGRKRSPEVGAKISAALQGRRLSAEHCEKIAARMKGNVPTNKGQPRSPESRAKMSAARKGWRPPPKILAAGAEWRAANAAAISAKRKAKWADPEYRDMMTSPERKAARAESQRRPEVREQQRATGKAKWADPEYRAMMLAARKK